MRIKSQFRVLLAKKAIRDDRTYTLRDVAEATGVSIYTITGFANNTLREFPREAMEAICQFLECQPGDLLESDSSSHNSGIISEDIATPMLAAT